MKERIKQCQDALSKTGKASQMHTFTDISCLLFGLNSMAVTPADGCRKPVAFVVLASTQSVSTKRLFHLFLSCHELFVCDAVNRTE